MPAVSEPGSAHCLYVTPDERIEVDPPQEHVRKALSSGQGLLWYRVAESDESSREILRDVFGFHQLAIDDCFNGRVDTPKIDDYGSYLFVIARSAWRLPNSTCSSDPTT
jgi:Mg2+ and Co2+ transporter CorA